MRYLRLSRKAHKEVRTQPWGTERDAEQTNKWNRVPRICFWLFSLKYLAY